MECKAREREAAARKVMREAAETQGNARPLKDPTGGGNYERKR